METKKKKQDDKYDNMLAAIILLGLATVVATGFAISFGVMYSAEHAWKEALVEKVCEHSGYYTTSCKGLEMMKEWDAETIKKMPTGSL